MEDGSVLVHGNGILGRAQILRSPHKREKGRSHQDSRMGCTAVWKQTCIYLDTCMEAVPSRDASPTAHNVSSHLHGVYKPDINSDVHLHRKLPSDVT